MAAQRGFVYETNTSNYLKTVVTENSPHGVVLQNFSPASAASDRPDIMINFNNLSDGLELKINNASFGSLVIKWDLLKGVTGNHWKWGEVGDHEEKIFLKDIGDSVNVLDGLRNHWVVPNLIADKEVWYESKSLPALRNRYEQDLASCPDQYFSVSSQTISRYYNTKNTHYINLGSHGFYRLGPNDPLGLNVMLRGRQEQEIPNWNNSHDASIRCRCQPKGISTAEAQEERTGYQLGAWGYQFTAEFSVRNISRSPYNIAPISSGVNIDTLNSNAPLVFQ